MKFKLSERNTGLRTLSIGLCSEVFVNYIKSPFSNELFFKSEKNPVLALHVSWKFR